ncbi:hypothetical protein HMPREF3038_01289 [Akkermansia sp. KLE1797]|nr:hypothetical protein HMPREF3038_01289 [Akkermansia sp. KLE1797]KXU52801.1 hypothetical protein HMPREF3039_02967 [Akkermansia sp. KLE1798]KZA04236.1 hypothetical protein HMPREF1326_02159 [Akkermansia sp. KLE1605]
MKRKFRFSGSGDAWECTAAFGNVRNGRRAAVHECKQYRKRIPFSIACLA